MITFHQAIQSGSHRNSIQMILDTPPIVPPSIAPYSEQALVDSPEIASQLTWLNPDRSSPMLPWVASTTLESTLRSTAPELTTMHDGQPAHRYSTQLPWLVCSVTDADYDPMRQMLKLAATIEFKM
ncbi:MAG: hypothetical protein U0175_30685 [Caldilineaceae bacterium]